MSGAIDLDDPRTWPPAVRSWAQERAAALAGSTEIAGDLNTDLVEREAEFRALFGASKMLVYHCTRLLEWEAEDIRDGGLVPLSGELVERRIARAQERGALSQNEAARL